MYVKHTLLTVKSFASIIQKALSSKIFTQSDMLQNQGLPRSHNFRPMLIDGICLTITLHF